MQHYYGKFSDRADDDTRQRTAPQQVKQLAFHRLTIGNGNSDQHPNASIYQRVDNQYHDGLQHIKTLSFSALREVGYSSRNSLNPLT